MWLAANQQRAANFDSIRAALAAAEEPADKEVDVVAELVEEPKARKKAELVWCWDRKDHFCWGGKPLPMMHQARL